MPQVDRIELSSSARLEAIMQQLEEIRAVVTDLDQAIKAERSARAADSGGARSSVGGNARADTWMQSRAQLL
eukprot:365030-Chlamydomonas_euryale.AAC.4